MTRPTVWGTPIPILGTGTLGYNPEEPTEDLPDPTDHALEDEGGYATIPQVGDTATEDVNETEGTVANGGGNKTFINPTRANDSSDSTTSQRGSFAAPGVGQTSILKTDLGAGFLVETVDILGGTGPNLSNFSAVTWVLENSSDGSSWSAVATTQSNTTIGTRALSTLTLTSPATERYWRITHTSGAGGFQPNLFVNRWSIYGDVSAGTIVWVDAPYAIDDDDATAEDVDETAVAAGDPFLRLELAAPRLIYRMEMRLGLEDAGSVTVTLQGSDDGEFPSPTTLTTITFTATGSLTAQDIAASWTATVSYKHYQWLVSTSQDVSVFTVSLFSPPEGVSEHGELTGLTDDDHTQYATVVGGGRPTVVDHGNMGATETIDAAAGNHHRGVLDANCTATITPFDDGGITIKVEQDGTGGFSFDMTSVVFEVGADEQPAQDPGAITFYTIISDDGVLYGFKAGGGGGGGTPATTVESETTFGITPAVGTDTEYARQDHTHGSPPTPDVEDTTYVDLGAVGATETVDCTDERVQHLLLDDDVTISLTGAVAGEAHRLRLLLQQDTTGGWVATWPAEVLWPGGVAPTLTTDPEHTDIVDLISVDGSEWFGVLVGADYATTVPAGGGSYWPMLALSSA